MATGKRAVIRPATPADATAIAAVRRASWFAAYDGIIDRAIIDRATALGNDPTRLPHYRRTLVAVASPGLLAEGKDKAAAGAAGGEPQVIIGFASFGPERMVPTAIPPRSPSPGATAGQGPARGTPGRTPPTSGELTPAGIAGETGELYAIYLDPDWWSAGVGRALTETVIAALREGGFRRVVLWTLTGNARARRFYERAGFTPDGTVNILTGLGDVEELRYTRDLFSLYPHSLDEVKQP